MLFKFKSKFKTSPGFRISIYLLLALFVAPALSFAINTLLDGYRITSTPQTIDAHGICKVVASTSANEYFAPTRTATEWNAFLNNAPADVSISNCSVCDNGGKSVGGYCWYLGAVGESCTQVCAAIGKTVDMTGTRDYAGSGGTLTNCESVGNAFGYSAFIDTAGGTRDIFPTIPGLGCSLYSGSAGERVYTPATTADASYSGGDYCWDLTCCEMGYDCLDPVSGFARFCACQ